MPQRLKITLKLCWVRAASGPFCEEHFISTSSGLKMGWVFVNTEIGPKVGFWGQQ